MTKHHNHDQLLIAETCMFFAVHVIVTPVLCARLSSLHDLSLTAVTT